DMGLIGRTGKQGELRRIGAGQIGPVALSFQAEHPGRALPAIADLTADRGTARGMASFGAAKGRGSDGERVRIPAVMAPCATIVAADVEAAPVIGDSHWQRFGVRADRKVRRLRARGARTA